MKLIGNPFTPVPKNNKSHVRGWALHWADLLDIGLMEKGQSFADLDVLYFEHGVNITPGQMNLFSGLNDDIATNILDIVLNPGLQVVSLDYEFSEMKYEQSLVKRLGQSTCSPLVSRQLIEGLGRAFSGADVLTQVDMFRGTVAIGDSHTTSYASAKSVVHRTNGLTLHGALKRGHFQEVASRYAELNPERVTLVAGSIDIRHHVGRLEDILGAIDRLVDGYIQAAIDISSELLCDVELACPVPVEYEGRKIPKTGFYNGAPFAGTLEERQSWTRHFMDRLARHYDGPIVRPPKDWYTMDPEEYAKENMELMSSVHISPHVYRRNGGWHDAWSV